MLLAGLGATSSNSYPPGHPPVAFTEIVPSLLPTTQVIGVGVAVMASAAVGPVMVKFLVTVQLGVMLNVAAIVYVPAAKLEIVIGPLSVVVPLVIADPKASTTA